MSFDFTDKNFVYGFAKTFIEYCDCMDIEYPDAQWEEERVFYREWLPLIEMEPFPERQARDLLARMMGIQNNYGTNFDHAITQIRHWIKANAITQS